MVQQARQHQALTYVFCLLGLAGVFMIATFARDRGVPTLAVAVLVALGLAAVLSTARRDLRRTGGQRSRR